MGSSVGHRFRPVGFLRGVLHKPHEEWCPNSNLFEDQMSAESWSSSRVLDGRILSLEEASVLATREWLPLFADSPADAQAMY